MTAPAQIAADTTPAPPSDPSAQRPGRTASRPWQRWALGVILVVSAALYGWDLWNAGWGNEFYTAAVKSMSKDFTNFLFGSFDPAGVVTVDKPPMGLWPQVVSVWVFGFHQWSVALPQALEGVAAVFLLHRTVRRWWGENVALLAAALLALTPITVAIDHVNNPDAALVLWSVAAAYALTRAVADGIAPRSRTKWLLLCAFLLGCAFVTKMLAGWIVVPGFAVAFLLAGGSSWKRRIGDLAGATGVLLVSSFWWPLLHDFWPGAPYMDNSTDGTALNLIFAYNGLNRIVGNDTPGGVARGGGAGGGVARGGGFGGGAGFSKEAEAQIERYLQARGGGAGGGFSGLFGGGTGLGRMFSSSVGGQISWLIPFSLFVLAIVVVVGVLRMRRKLPAQPALRAGWMMWGSWLIVTGVVFSYAQGIWHSYYTTMLAPPIAAIAAAGLAVLWRYYRDSRGLSWLLLPLGVALTAGWAFVLVERVPTWNGWAGPAVLAVAALAVLVLVLTKLVRVTAGSARPAQFGLALAGVALVLVPAVWSSATAFAGERGGGAMASAGPTTTGGFGGGGGRGGTGGTRGGGRGGTGRGTGNATRNAAFGGSDQALTADEQKILAYVVRNAPNARIKLAIEGTSNQAAPWIINSNDTVIGMGGFMGSDNAPSVAQLTNWVATGQLKYVLGTTTGSGRGGAGGFGGAAAGGRGGSYATARSEWISKNCTAVPASAYGGTTSTSTGGGGGGGGGIAAFFGGGGAQTLYLCTAK